MAEVVEALTREARGMEDALEAAGHADAIDRLASGRREDEVGEVRVMRRRNIARRLALLVAGIRA